MKCQHTHTYKGQLRDCPNRAADNWTTCHIHLRFGEDRGHWQRYWTSMGMGDMARKAVAT